MKKHISLVIVFSILLLALTSISPPVKAKQDIQETEHLAIDIYGNEIPNSKYENGLYEKGLLISPYDFIFENLSEEQKENAFFSFSGFDDYMYLSYNSGTAEEIEIAKQNFILRTGMSEDGTYHFPFFYITSIKDFESYLIDSGYIREGESWKDIDVSEFGSRVEILERLEERKLGYLISKNNIPGYFYQSSYISSDTNILELNIIYKIDELYDYYICNGKISYTNSSSSDVIWEVANVSLPDSFGKIKAISANKFIYEYSILRYNNEFGYYGYKQDDEIYNIELNINQIPSFLFDTKGNLKDNYISFRDNLWYLVKVNDVTKLINGSYTYLRKNTSALNNGFIYFEIYFNFNLPIDTLEYIEFNLPIRKVIKVFDWVVRSEAFLTNMKMSVHKDEKVSHLNINNSNWFNHFFSITKKENAIQKGDYLINNFRYEFKILYSDDNYYMFYNDDKVIDWSSTTKNDTVTYFSNNIYINDNDSTSLKSSGIYTYKSIVFSYDDLEHNYNKSPDDPGDEEGFWEWFIKKIKELWNWNYPYGMLIVIVIFLALFGGVMYLFWPLIKVIIGFFVRIFIFFFNSIKKLFNKKNKSM